MTFVLCFVVQMTACWPKSIAKNIAPFAIGMVVFTAHAVLLPVDGCSINPTRCVWHALKNSVYAQTVFIPCRSFGPAIVSGTYPNFWVFWVGPLSGAIISVPFYLLFRMPVDTVPVETEDDEVVRDNIKGSAKMVDATTAGYGYCMVCCVNTSKVCNQPMLGTQDCLSGQLHGLA